MDVSNISKYSMHKYWGKKPATGLKPLVEKYSKEGDWVIDPFAGYGVFCCEAFLENRNVIINDLNPIANFIEKNLFSTNVDTNRLKKAWSRIREEIMPFINAWYDVDICGNAYHAVSVLRDRNNLPVRLRYKTGEKTNIIDIPSDVARLYVERENAYNIEDWYPQDVLIENSRISATPGMRVSDLFTKRTLACHARLFKLINEHSDGEERDLMLMAFTANIANCSKLVPPIKTRGALSQGAWMTGFYVGETYIENNVLHYFENRLDKVIKGKEDFLRCVNGNLFRRQASSEYRITCDDAKHLSVEDNSIDYIFTDPPYGDSVPYFEQSILWNSWLGKQPSYEDEIVVSDSNSREKDVRNFEKDINMAISEIRRVLKVGKYFSLTFHSISGLEWKAVTNACVTNNFSVVEFEWLEQKTFTPRQLNRQKSIKGDVLVTFKKNAGEVLPQCYSDEAFSEIVYGFILKKIRSGITDTNGILMAIMEWVLRNMILIGNVDVFKILCSRFNIDDKGHWFAAK